MTDFNYTRLGSPDSTTIQLAAYDDHEAKLLLRFVNGSCDYVYSDVPAIHYDELVDPGNSAGRYYNEFVWGEYDSERVDGHVWLVERPIASVTPITDVSAATDFGLDALLGATAEEFDKYGVRWTTTDTRIGPFEATYQATDEADALRQFNKEIENFGLRDVKALAVFHYFE